MDKDVVKVDIDPYEFTRGLNKIIFDEVLCDKQLEGVNQDFLDYENSKFLVAIYKDRGMLKSKQMMMGDLVSILTALCSALEVISNQVLPDPKINKDIKKLLYDLTGIDRSGD